MEGQQRNHSNNNHTKLANETDTHSNKYSMDVSFYEGRGAMTSSGWRGRGSFLRFNGGDEQTVLQSPSLAEDAGDAADSALLAISVTFLRVFCSFFETTTGGIGASGPQCPDLR